VDCGVCSCSGARPPRRGPRLWSVTPLVVGSDSGFVDRGEHELKGVPGSWRLFAVQ